MMRTIGLSAIVAAASFPALGQEAPALAEGQLTLDISTKFISAHREKDWVPVDAIISNNKQNVRGYATLTVSQFGVQRSPTIQVPVESPKNSRKRVRFYCQLGKADRLQVMLYHKRRPVLPAPMQVQLRPVDADDVLAMLIDDRGPDYGFIYSALQRGGGDYGYHREEIRVEDLALLPDHQQCYDPYNFIVIGETDPTAVPGRQRELITRYVERGGTLILCAGENAPRLRGTWVEDLAGVRIGELKTIDEEKLAAAAFSESQREGARAGREVVLTELTPVYDDVYARGRRTLEGDLVLATLRRVGDGHVATIGVDAPQRALQGCAGYLDLWRELALLGAPRKNLNFDKLVEQASYTLPAAAGIRVYPRSSVLKYLGLYFAFGVVANWVIWSLLKRREMAWVCLVFISFGFTAYALIYGTAGRAKETELAQLEVIRVESADGDARLYSLSGILAARSAHYDFGLKHPYSLIADVDAAPDPYLSRPSRGLFESARVFDLIQTQPARVKNFTVGASEMRMFQVESDFGIARGIEGTLIWGKSGLRGTLFNRTGLALRRPFILVDGLLVPISEKEDRFEVAVTPEKMAISSLFQPVNSGYPPTLWSLPMEHESLRGEHLEELVVNTLTADPEAPFVRNADTGPFLCAWVGQGPIGSVELQEPAIQEITHTLLVADIRIERQLFETPKRTKLVTTVKGQTLPTQPYMATGFGNQQYFAAPHAPVEATIAIPQAVVKKKAGNLEIDLIWSSALDYYRGGGEDSATVKFIPNRGLSKWTPSRVDFTSESRSVQGINVRLERMKKDEWWEFVDPETGTLDGIVRVETRTDLGVRFWMRARLEAPRSELDYGEWFLWR